jgi:hypothetical protein
MARVSLRTSSERLLIAVVGLARERHASQAQPGKRPDQQN